MRVCIVCNTDDTIKWYSGPKCRRCYSKELRRKNPEQHNNNRKKWMKEHPGRRSQYEAKYRKDHREHYLISQKYKEALHRATKLQATPKWLNKEQKDQIKSIYANCPSGWHVDHIIPLKGKEVKGLHVPWNLQYLPATDNINKSNKVCDIINSDEPCGFSNKNN